jgi:hypothetical protein
VESDRAPQQPASARRCSPKTTPTPLDHRPHGDDAAGAGLARWFLLQVDTPGRRKDVRIMYTALTFAAFLGYAHRKR